MSETNGVSANKFAVEVRNVAFKYGDTTVIKGVNSSVARGQIYSLVGPSGCGKTTLMKCIAGISQPTGGHIFVHGTDVKSHLTAGFIGYMPQEIALFADLTIKECLHFFGKIVGLGESERNEHITVLEQELGLCDMDRLINTLSGGNQRRISLAVALIQKPSLLLLDEPTVGLDPLITAAAWRHLRNLCEVEGVAVILTTHYIEEARQSHKLAVMRNGTIIAETEPNTLISNYHADSLEAAVLSVCRDADLKAERASDACELSTGVQMCTTTKDVPNVKRVSSLNKTTSLVHTTTLSMSRKIGHILMLTLFPAMQVLAVIAGMGCEPRDLNMAVYDGDKNYSKIFLKQLDPFYVNVASYSSPDAAIAAIREGDAWAAIIVQENYTTSIVDRLSSNGSVSQSSLESSKILVYTDNSGLAVHATIRSQIVQSMAKYLKLLMKQSDSKHSCKIDVNSTMAMASTCMEDFGLKMQYSKFEPFIQVMEPPVLGPSKPSFRDYLAPSSIVIVAFLQSAAMAAIAFMKYHKDGCLDRLHVCDVNITHLWISHVIVHGVITVGQTTICVLLLIIFDVYNVGNLFLVFLLGLMQGFVGMSFGWYSPTCTTLMFCVIIFAGFLMSVICPTEKVAIGAVIAMFFCSAIMGGLFTPIQAMPEVIKMITNFMPVTLTFKAMHAIVGRGHGLLDKDVLLAFTYNTVMLAILNTLAIVIAKLSPKMR